MPTKDNKLLLALLLPFLACAVQLLLWNFLQPFAYLLFYPAVFFSSRLAGRRAGFAATAISALFAVYFFIPPRFSLLLPQGSHLVSVFVFVTMGLVFGWSHERLQQARAGESDARALASSSEAELREARIDLLEMERCLAQQRLQETEEQFRIMFMESSVGEARLDPETGSFLKVNPAFCRMTGYSEGDLLGMDLVAVTHPQERGISRESLKGLDECGGNAVQTELTLLRSDGTSVYCQATLNVLRDAGGRANSILAVLQDISARRQAEEALLKSEEKFSLAFSGNPAALALTRFEDGAFLEVNETWEAMTGYDREEVIGKSGRHIWPDQAAVQRFLAQLRDTGTVRGWEQEFNRKNGERFVAQLWSQLLSVGGEQVILSTLVDITQLKQAEAALRDSENRFRTIFDHAPVAIGIGAVDDSRLLDVNSAWLRLLGFQREEVLGRTALELGIYLDRRTREEILAAISQGRGLGRELQLKRKSGEIIDVLFAADVVVLDGTPSLLVMLSDVTVQKQAERALQKSKQDYQQLFQNMLEGFAFCRVVWGAAGAVEDFVFLNVNRALLQLTGREELVGKRVSQVIARVSETNAEFLAACGRVAQTGLPEHLETFVVPLDQWWAVSLYGVERGYFVALCHNITVRKREELRRNATVELLRICNEATGLDELMSRTVRFFLDLTGCRGIGVRLRSGEGYPYFQSVGLPREQASTGGSLCDRVSQGMAPPDAGEGALRCLCAEVLAGNAAGEGRAQGSYWTSTGTGAAQGGGGTRCHAEAFQSLALIPLRSHGEMIGLFQFSDPAPGLMSAEKVALYEDLVDYISISFSKLRADQALVEASQYNQQIIAGAQEGIIVYDRELRCQVWNPYMEQLTGIGAGEMLGRRPQEVIPSLRESGVVALLSKSLEGEDSSPVDFRFSVEQTGRSGWVTDTRAPLKDVQGEIIGVITTVRDITAERRLEEQLRQAQKMEAVGLLAGGIAHDFNNVLQVIMGYCSLLAADPRLDEAQKGEVEQILVSAERAAQLTKGLLAFSRKQVMEPRRLNLCDIVQHVQKFLVRIIGEDITLAVVRCPRPEIPVIADSGHIEQVLINLATNARDAMSKGGTLTVGMEVVEVEAAIETQFGHAEPGSYACVVMTDTGSGMDEETRGRIFEPFFTTKEIGKGTGLGMAIVYGIVKQHGGFINVYSEPGLGTTFRVYLPLAKESDAQAAGPVQLPPPSGGSETLLLAEDDVEVRRLLVTMLTRFGYRVIEAADGQQAVDLFAEHQDSIALVVMDLIMPRKNGMEAGVEIVQLKPGTRILYSSGYTSDFMERRGILEQDIHLIMKPVQPVQLLRKVREMLDG